MWPGAMADNTHAGARNERDAWHLRLLRLGPRRRRPRLSHSEGRPIEHAVCGTLSLRFPNGEMADTTGCSGGPGAVTVWASCGAVSTRAILQRVTDPGDTDETRIDRWLCAVRLVKTRPLATRLCEGGHVQVNGSPAKPSTKVRAGDRVEARIADRDRVVEVVRPIESRVGAAVAATCYVDHSPPVTAEAGPAFVPVRGEGRPGKHLRRELERLRRAADA
jgi:ribosome-associated heat shock protein Hsp15